MATRTPAGVTISVSSVDLNPRNIIEILARNGWGSTDDYTEAGVRTMFEASYYALALIDGKVVGYVRALTDRVLTTWIAELIVLPAHQRSGIGRALIERLIADQGHTAIYSEAIHGAEHFFEKHGLRGRTGTLVACSRRPDPKPSDLAA